MKKNVKTLRGGGENKSLSSLTSTQASNLDSRGIFKPFIASSLALALGVSVASGATTQPATCSNGTGAPVICTSGGSDISSTLKIQWSNGGSGDIFKPQSQDNSNADITKLTFQFNGSTSTGSGNATNYVAKIDSSATSLTIDGNGKSIQMNDGSGTLVFQTTKDKTMNLTLDNLTNTTNYALYGVLQVSGNGIFNGTFGGAGISGTVTMNGGTNDLVFNSGSVTGMIRSANGTNTMTFKDEVTSIGRIWVHQGTNTLTFERNAHISGTELIYAGNSYGAGGDGTGGNTLIFQGENNSITATNASPLINYNANPQKAKVDNLYNRLVFEKGTNLIKGDITGSVSANSVWIQGKNIIWFKDTTTQNTIQGNINKDDNTLTNYSYNTIIFEGGASSSGATLENLNQTSKNIFQGDIYANGGGENNIIYFKQDGYIKGNIIATMFTNEPSLGTLKPKLYGENLIVFDAKARIDGDIKTTRSGNSSAHGNYLVFGGNTLINGDVSSTSFKGNNIHFSTNLTINGTLDGGHNKIWGTKTGLTKGSTETEIWTNAKAIFFNNPNGTLNTPDNANLQGTLIVTKGASGSNIDLRADTITLGNNTIDPSNTFAFKSTGGSTLIAKNGTINGNVVLSRTNTITFLADGTGAINGNVVLSGTNTITFHGTTNSITGNITTSGTSQTNITSTTTLNIGSQGNAVSLIANGDNIQNNTSFGNTINVTGNLTAYFSSIETSGTAHQYQDAHKNSIVGGSGSVINVSGNITANREINGTNSNELTADVIKVEGNIIISGTGGKGRNTLTINGQGSYIAGNITNDALQSSENNIILAGTNADLTLKGSTNQITNLEAKGTANTLALDGSRNVVNAEIATLKGGDKLTVNFGAQSNDKTLAIKNVDSGASGTLTLKEITFDGASTNNTLDLSGLNDKVTTITLTDKITVGNGSRQGLTLKFRGDTSNGTSVIFTNGITTASKGTSTIELTEGNATFSGGDINITNFYMTGSGDSTATFKSNTTIGTLTAQASGKNELVIGESGDTSLTIGTTNSSLASVTLAGDTAVLEINGGKQSIGTLTTSATANNLSFKNNNLTIGEISNTGSKEINLTLDNSTLSLKGDNTTLNSLTASNGVTINLAMTDNAGNPKSRAHTARKTLTVGKYNGNANAVVYVEKKSTGSKADTIVINNADGNNNSLVISAMGNIEEINSITDADQVEVAKLENGAQGKVNISGGTSIIDGEKIQITVKPASAGSNSYIISNTKTLGVDTPIQDVASTTLMVNYDLYIANFNSLNKRMGELRDNANSQGVWARVFGGAMRNDFGAGSKTNYVTAQAGYDYALSVGENAKNYVGVAVAYGKSWTKANQSSDPNQASLSNVDSQMAEVGVYNSYVADNGWYNDTILKFSYIMSDFTLHAGSNVADNSTNNFAMILSDEFGYRYKFGSEKSWYIDPQVEVGFGYFNQSDFNQALNSLTQMNVTQDSILTLRTRAGMSLGKKFTTENGFASIYVGAFYEYDFINGGSSEVLLSSGSSNPLNGISSNGRTIVNVGSNIELTEGVRMYIDVEKSFGDKQRTFMQFNFGARYSFGEKTLSAQSKTNSAPLKIENQNSQEQSDQSNSKEENTQANSQEQNTSSKE